MTASHGYNSEYVPPTPLAAQGGIAARSRDGAIGESWWSERFIDLLESFGLGSRLERGRAYARAGQVTELDVEPGIVLAKVQGSRYTPYRVRIRAKTLTEPQWRRVEKAMAARALPLANSSQPSTGVTRWFSARSISSSTSRRPGESAASSTRPPN